MAEPSFDPKAELASLGAPRSQPLSWAAVASLVLLGLAMCAGAAVAAGSVAARPRPRPAPQADPTLLAEAVQAYEAGEWEEAERAFRKVLEQAPEPARAQDYLDRLALTRKDAERLTQAEEALVAGDPRLASQLASAVAPSSPLFAQAERVARSAHEQLTRESEAS